jgi:hypothetical protein
VIRIVKIAPNYGDPFYAAQQPRLLRCPLYLCSQDPENRDILKFPDPGSLLQEITDNYIRMPKDWIPLKLKDFGYALSPSVAFVLRGV